jgi:hypothetical protein
MPITLVLGLIKAGLSFASSWMERQDREKLRQSGALEEIAGASARLLVTVRRKNAVDDALFAGDDPDWADRLRRDAEAAGRADG